MKTYEQDFRAYLTGQGVLLAEEGRGRFVIDRESLLNLEKLVGALAAQVERFGDTILEIEADPPLHRFSARELKDDVACLIRRLGHLRSEVAADHASGIPRSQTSRDRQEIEALAVAIPVMEAVLRKSRADKESMPGGKPLADKRGVDPLVAVTPVEASRELPSAPHARAVVKPTSNGVAVRRKSGDPHR